MTSGAELDEIEHAILAGSVVALRKRAQARREKAAAAKPGEAYIANRLAAVLMEIADDLTRGALTDFF